VTLGLSLGITCAIFMIAAAWLAWGFGIGMSMVEQHHINGYNATFLGGLVGGLWGLIEGFIFGFILALVHNGISRCKSSCSACGCQQGGK